VPICSRTGSFIFHKIGNEQTDKWISREHYARGQYRLPEA